MADWEEPATDQVYTDHFGSIRDKDTSLVKMLDGTSDTNLPTGAKRKNSGQKYRLEEWDGSSWNMVEPGLGDLTQAEVDQLAAIGSTTINATQWGWLGGLAAQPVTGAGDGLTKSGAQLAVGSSVLRSANLAANGGNVVTDDRKNVFKEGQEISNAFPYLLLTESDVADDNFRINVINGRVSFDQRTDSNATSLTWFQLDPNGGIVIGSPNFGSRGLHTVNAEELYDNGNRVYSASNAPASTNLSDGTALLAPGSSSDPGLAFDTWRTPNANRATFVTVRSRTVTDGSTQGLVEFRVDESGGTAADYTGVVSYAPSEGTVSAGRSTVSFLVPPGGSYEIRNSDDPNGQNTIETHREFTL